MAKQPQNVQRSGSEEARTAAFIARWHGKASGELANAQSFMRELCELLALPIPAPRTDDAKSDLYVFERSVTFQNGDGTTAGGRIDLYRHGCFVLEAKQIGESVTQVSLPGLEAGKPKPANRWDRAMLAARNQAERYARALHDMGEDWVPFLIVADIGHSFSIYSDFTQSGRTYVPFPDQTSYRIQLSDLAQPEIRDRLKAIWTDPLSLDPARHAARVTRDIADRLARIAKSLETDHPPDKVADFLMRCLFTMFAEDIGLLPEDGFTRLLSERHDDPVALQHSMGALWKTMNEGGFEPFLGTSVPEFDGGFFRDQSAIRLSAEQIDLMMEAAKADWREVEPAIFGTLLERALDPKDRHKLGAHFTPRAYVERLVLPTLVEPLREDWAAVQAAATREVDRGRIDSARKLVRDFLDKLREVRVLDPAAGSGNFLYVALEHMKRLEGEVLETLRELGEPQEEAFGVDPGQFIGLELNPRAVPIAETVLWIGYLQWHFRTRGNRALPTPILKAYGNIRAQDAVLAYDRHELVRDKDGKPITRWDGLTTKPHPVTGREVPDETARIETYVYKNPRPATWPNTDFIVGNPPFIGNKRMRAALGDGYTEALRAAYPDVPESVDFVLYWWHKAAELVSARKARRFGLISTN